VTAVVLNGVRMQVREARGELNTFPARDCRPRTIGMFVVLLVVVCGAANSSRSESEHWSVADNVAIARLPQWFDGYEAGAPFRYSQDSRYVAFVLLSPRVGTPVTVATLFVYRVDELRAAPKGNAGLPKPVFETAAESEDIHPAIRQVVWHPTNESLGYVLQAGAESRVMIWNSGSSASYQISTSSQTITELRFLGSGQSLAYAAISDTPEKIDDVRVIGDESLASALRIKESLDMSRLSRLSVVDLKHGFTKTFDIDLAAGWGLWPSPDGNYIAAMEPFDVAWDGGCWRELDEPNGTRLNVRREKTEYVFIDVRSGAIARPFGGPTGYATGEAVRVRNGLEAGVGAYWSADSTTAVVPFSLSATSRCVERSSGGSPGLFTYSPQSHAVEQLISYAEKGLFGKANEEKLVNLELTVSPKGSDIDVAMAVGTSTSGLIAWSEFGKSVRWAIDERLHRQTDGHWTDVARVGHKKELVISKDTIDLLKLDEAYNLSPRIDVVGAFGGRRTLIDLAPHAQGRLLGSVEEITWTDSQGSQWNGLLSFPADYELGKRYPLLIQTHGYQKDRFFAGGPDTTTAFPGRAATARGFLVLTITDTRVWASIKDEIPRVVDGWASAIADLDKRKIIDPKRVGVIGWSRTGWYVLSALLRRPSLFAAAVVADNVDYGYLQYLGAYGSAYAHGAENLYGGRPGSAGSTWPSMSIGFNAARVNAPVLFQADSGAAAILDEWEAFASLRNEGVPAELWAFPKGAHGLVRPIDQQASQEASLDWMDFWLNSHEDSELAKTEQYTRWRNLRDSSRANQTQGGSAARYSAN
jgi:hypothetical protein